jgi:hypothetical protein
MSNQKNNYSVNNKGAILGVTYSKNNALLQEQGSND